MWQGLKITVKVHFRKTTVVISLASSCGNPDHRGAMSIPGRPQGDCNRLGTQTSQTPSPTISWNTWNIVIESEIINSPKQQNTKKNWARATRSFLRILSQTYLAWCVWPVRKGIYIVHKKVGSLGPILPSPPLPWLYEVNTRGIYRMLVGQTNGCMTMTLAQMDSRLEMWELNSSNSPCLAISNTSAWCMNYRCLKSKRMYRERC